MSEEPQSLIEGRVAILGISYQDMRALGVTERFLSPILFGHWEGDDWVQPESRIPLRRLLDALCLPPSWEIVSRSHIPTVWTEPAWAVISILLTSPSFPRVPEGTIPDTIHVEVSSLLLKDAIGVMDASGRVNLLRVEVPDD
jgi:hypothetical protein